MYTVPERFFFRIHHIRPRFKNDVENVLFFVANEVAKVPALPYDDFKTRLNAAIRSYPGNATVKQKTIDNWRTEISALFGFIQRDTNAHIARPSAMALNLAEKQDLVQFFKYFLFYFQYPGGHLKINKNQELLNAGINFKPAKYILKLLEEGEKLIKARFGVKKAEITHCVFNDLRVTRDNRNPDEVVNLILENRETSLDYDWSGDVIRYAGDILDYMVIADLLKVYPNGMYYINWVEREAIMSFIYSDLWYEGYNTLSNKPTVKQVKEAENDWFNYVNHDIRQDIFETDVLKYLDLDEKAYSPLVESATEAADNEIVLEEITKTKEIGDLGENLIIGHESMRLKNAGKGSLIHLIKKIPTYLAIGYDVQSLEPDETKRLIEVKTTISSKPINFYNFHLTTNEWNAAQSYEKRYFVYRLMVSKDSKKLFVINDPIAKFREGKIRMTPRDGADMVFNERSGNWEELLIWEK